MCQCIPARYSVHSFSVIDNSTQFAAELQPFDPVLSFDSSVNTSCTTIQPLQDSLIELESQISLTLQSEDEAIAEAGTALLTITDNDCELYLRSTLRLVH